MKTLQVSLVLSAAVLLLSAGAARALTVDVCVNAGTDARFDSTGNFFTGSAPIYPGGTLSVSASAIDCSSVAAAPIGTFFTNGGIVAGLPASAPDDLAIVTWHFRIGNHAFDTIGPVKVVPAGGKYPQVVVGATSGLRPNDQAIVTALDPTGFVFEVSVPGNNR
jgi:hypothetical protein